MLFSLLFACINEFSNDTQSSQTNTTSDFVESPDTDSTGSQEVDSEDNMTTESLNPFDVKTRDAHGLTNTSSILEEVLEFGSLTEACSLYEQYPDDVDLKVRCGKAMFFYEGYDGIGIPQPLFDFVNSKFTDILGESFSTYGMIPDPYSDKHRPIGYGDGAKIGGVDTLAYSCASCHFGQLPDGRYSVGMPNTQYETGKHFLSLMLLPQSVMPGFNDEEHNEDALEVIQPLREKLWGNPLLMAQMGWDLLPLLFNSEMSPDAITPEIEAAYASWKSGTMDVFIAPLPIDDGVHVVTKIPSLWSIPTEAEISEFDMDSAMLSWNGGSPSLQHFLKGYISLSGTTEWTTEELEPLIAYLETLEAPDTLEVLDTDAVERGELVFQNHCTGCHQGYQGSGVEPFSFEEIGTDDQLRYLLDADADGIVDYDIDAVAMPTVKSQRLTGVWAKERLLHNGSVETLESLFCLESPRVDDRPIFGNVGHNFGCELTERDRIDLIEFLRSI